MFGKLFFFFFFFVYWNKFCKGTITWWQNFIGINIKIMFSFFLVFVSGWQHVSLRSFFDPFVLLDYSTNINPSRIVFKKKTMVFWEIYFRAFLWSWLRRGCCVLSDLFAHFFAPLDYYYYFCLPVSCSCSLFCFPLAKLVCKYLMHYYIIHIRHHNLG